MITYQEAYEKALKAIPRDIRFVKTDDGEYERVDVNEKMRKEYAEQLVKKTRRTNERNHQQLC